MPSELRDSFQTSTASNSFSSPSVGNSTTEVKLAKEDEGNMTQTRNASKSHMDEPFERREINVSTSLISLGHKPSKKRLSLLDIRKDRLKRAMSDPIKSGSEMSSNSDEKHLMVHVRDYGYDQSRSQSFASDGAGIVWFTDWPMHEVENKYNRSWVRFLSFYITVFIFALSVVSIWHSIPLDIGGNCQNVYMYTLLYVGVYYWFSVVVMVSWLKFTAGIQNTCTLAILSVCGYILNSIFVLLLEKYVSAQWFRWLISCALIVSLLPIVFSNLLWQLQRSQIQGRRVKTAWRGFVYVCRRLLFLTSMSNGERIPGNIRMFWASIWMITAVWVTFLASVGMSVIFDVLTTDFEQSLFPILYLIALTLCGIILVRVGSLVDETLNITRNSAIPTLYRKHNSDGRKKKVLEQTVSLMFELSDLSFEGPQDPKSILEDFNFRSDSKIYGIEELHVFLKLIGLNWDMYEVNKLFNKVCDGVVSDVSEISKIFNQTEICEAYKKFETYGSQPSVKPIHSFVRREISIQQLWEYYDFRDVGRLTGGPLNYFLYCLLLWTTAYETKEKIPLPKKSKSMIEKWKGILERNIPSLFENGVISERNFHHVDAFIRDFLIQREIPVPMNDTLDQIEGAGSTEVDNVIRIDGKESTGNLVQDDSVEDSAAEHQMIIERYENIVDFAMTRHDPSISTVYPRLEFYGGSEDEDEILQFSEKIKSNTEDASINQVREDHKKLFQEFGRARIERVLSNEASFGSFKSKVFSNAASSEYFDESNNDLDEPIHEEHTLGSKTATFFWFLLYRATYFQLFLKIHNNDTVIIWVLLDLARNIALYIVPLTSVYIATMTEIDRTWGAFGVFLHVILRSPTRKYHLQRKDQDNWSEKDNLFEYSYRIFQTYLLDASITFLCLFEFIVSTSVLYAWNMNRAYIDGMTEMGKSEFENLMMIVLLLVCLEILTVVLIMLILKVFFHNRIESISRGLRRLFGSEVFQWIFFTGLVHCLQDPWLFRNTVQFCGHSF